MGCDVHVVANCAPNPNMFAMIAPPLAFQGRLMGNVNRPTTALCPAL